MTGEYSEFDRDKADWCVLGTVAVGRHVALAGVHGEFHPDFGAVIQRADDVVGVQNLDIADSLNVAGLDRARALLAHNHALGAIPFHLDCDFLDVQHDVGDVLANAADRGEFMQHAVDLHGGDRGTPKRRQQHAAKRISKRQAEATLERFGDQRRLRLALRGKLDFVGLDKFLPIFLDHLVFLPLARTIQS